MRKVTFVNRVRKWRCVTPTVTSGWNERSPRLSS